MFDALGAGDAADLLLSPGDEAEFVAVTDWPGFAGRLEPSRLYVVLHRRHGLWTHAYRVTAGHRPGQRVVHLLRAAEGDRRRELRDWLFARLDARPPRR
jgi:hypothetical protein